MKDIFKNIKKAHYDLRRVELLMRVRDELVESHEDLVSISFLVTSICFLKFSKIEDLEIKKEPFLANLSNKRFACYLHKRYN